MKSIDIFPWNDNFNTGLPHIDEQHRRLVQLLNLLASHVAFNADIPALNVILDEVADYAVYHFQTEEAVWHTYFPGDLLETRHKQLHDSFVQTVLTLKGGPSDKSVNTALEELLAFLTRWLASHILESDRYLAMVVLAMQSGMALDAAKRHADETMRGTTRVLIDIILSIYESLSSNTLHLMRELADHHRDMEKLQMLSLAVEQSPSSIVITDLDANIGFVNQAFVAATGYTCSEAIGLNPRILQSGKTPRATYADLWETLLRGDIWKGEFINKRKDGSEYIELALIAPVRQLDGTVTHYLAIKDDITVRKNLERNLAEQLSFTQAIIDAEVDGIAVCQGIDQAPYVHFSVWNRSMQTLTGYSLEEINRLGWYQTVYIDPEVQERARQRMERMRQGDHLLGEEWTITRKNGEQRVLQIYTILCACDDKGPHVLAVMHDMTERKQAETALRASNQQLHSLLDSMAEGAYGVDNEGTCRFVNRSFLRILGYEEADADAIIGQHIHELIHHSHPDGSPYPAGECRMYAAYRRSEEIHVTDEVFWRKDGTAVPVEYWSQPIIVDGTVTGASATFVDISVRKRAEEAILSASRYARSLIEASLDPLVTISPDGKITDVNTATEQATGLDRAILIGRDFADLFTDPEQAREGYRQAFARGFVTDYPLAIRHVDGRVSEVLYNASAYRDDAGAVAGVFAAARDVTQRRQLERELRESRDFLRQMLDSMAEGVYGIDTRGDCTFVNQAALRLLGYAAPDELVGQHLHERIHYRHPDGRQFPAEECPAHDTLQHLKPYHSEDEVFWRKDGGAVPVEYGLYPMVKDGEVVGAIGTFLDITGRKHAESALRESEANLRRAQQVASIGSWHIDFGTQALIWSAETYRIFGLPEGLAMAYPSFLRAVHPDDREAVAAAWQAALAGAAYDIEHRILVNGEVRWVSEKAELEFDARGEQVGGLGTVQDITRQKLADAAVRESEERFRIFTQQSGDAFVMMNGEDGRILIWNAAAEAMFGYPAAEAIGQELHRLIVPVPFREAAARGMRHFGRTGEGAVVGKTLELQALRRNGEEFPVELTLAAIHTPERWLAAGVVRDITERKRTEQEIIRARSAALAASQAKSEFLANMSHEIRTPMNAILGLTQILERDTLTPDQREILRKINDAGESLLRIINDILDFSKLEAGHLKLDYRPFELQEQLDRIANLLAGEARVKGLDLAIRGPEGLAGVLIGDWLRIKQVIVNLVGNAVKFTEQGRVEVRVIPLQVTERQARLRFEVSDTGIGIAPEVLAGLFRPFTQADAGTTRRFGGTGLGLSISKRLVEQMGGAIGATSAPGMGSTFWFELPFARANTVSAGAALTPEPAPAKSRGPRLSGLRVLAVDDNRINLFMLERALQLEGAEVHLAADGRQALQTLKTAPHGFDVVLMDIQMPVLDGLDATRAIRADAELAGLPVIALTAGVLAEEREAARLAGMDDFLAKPLDLEQMVAMLRPFIPQGPLAADAAPAGSERTGSPPGSDTPAGFPAIAGIDTARAALLLGHDRAYFLQMLGLFVEEFRELPQQLRADLGRNDPEAAARRVHNLKGNAGNLGAMDLMQVAQILESAIREGAPDLPAQIDRLGAQLAALLEAGAPWLSEAPPADAGTPVPPLDPEQLARLRKALENHDLGALNLYTELKSTLAAVYDATTMQALSHAMRHLRFEDALRLLRHGGD